MVKPHNFQKERKHHDKQCTKSVKYATGGRYRLRLQVNAYTDYCLEINLS